MAHKELIYLKGYAKGKGYNALLKAIHIANTLHKEQWRRDGSPYIVHPTRVATHLASLGISHEHALAAAMLHDVIEDCGVSAQTLTLIHGVPKDVVDIVELLSYNRSPSKDNYYTGISKNRFATIIKIADRCNNVSTMAGTFDKDKVKEYIA